MIIRFEWDAAKAAANRKKHGISFETAMRVFADPFALTEQDRIEGGERRWQTLGLVGGHVLLLVAHTVGDEEIGGHAIEVIRIVSAQRPIVRKGDAMKTTGARTVRREVDVANLPPLTAKQKAELEALAAIPEAAIDYGDIPASTGEPFKDAVRGRFHRPVKKQITARVDADVLAWLRAQGKGYQGRMNAILRREMLASVRPRRRVSR